jgi:YidC/Oxa1 family membrane protein insertase
MNAIYDFFGKIMGWLLNIFCGLFGGNFALSIFFFTMIINLVFIPLNIKQQKGMAAQARIKNKMEKIKEKYKDDKQRYQEEMGRLYQETGSNPMSGCLLLFIRLPFFVGIYRAVMYPFSMILGVSEQVITSAQNTLFAIKDTIGLSSLTDASQVTQMDIFRHIGSLSGTPISEYAEKINFNLFGGIDLTVTPKFNINVIEGWDIVWIVPLLSFATALLSSIISSHLQHKANPDAPSMRGMMLMMPLFSLWIAFTVPGAVGFYWACSNLFSMMIQLGIQQVYTPGRIIAKQEADEIKKRLETEKKKMQLIGDGVKKDAQQNQ